MSKIITALARGIKENKWIEIQYDGSNGFSKFWIAINDIIVDVRSNQNKKTIHCESFNWYKYEQGTGGYQQDYKIILERIKSAKVIDDTYHDTPDVLIRKIEENNKNYAWLNFSSYDGKVLDYLLNCVEENFTPFCTKKSIIEKLDIDDFKRNKSIKLNNVQFKKIINDIINVNRKTRKGIKDIKVKLGINIFGVSKGEKVFPMAYKSLSLDIRNMQLVAKDGVKINEALKSDGYHIRNFLPVDLNQFQENIENNIDEYSKMIVGNKKYYKVDTIPYIFELQREITTTLYKEYDAIKTAKEENKLSTPLKAFFGDMTKRNLGRKKDISIVIKDERVNIDQLSVIHNSMKNFVTYVQGPPGTGKTTTILNVILSCFYNSFTVLVSSNNNTPIDGIYNSMKTIKYYNQFIDFPVLRVSKNENMNYFLDDVKEKYLAVKHEKVYIEKLNKLSQKHLIALENTLEGLEKYDQIKAIEEKIITLQNVLKNVKFDFHREVGIQAQITELENEKKRIYIDEQLILKNLKISKEIFQWMKYKAIEYFKRLDEPKNEALREIILQNCNTAEERKQRVVDFNKHIKDDDNFKKMLKIFPIIVSTNISSSKLGTPKPNFDLCILDEAGQCDIANSLTPINRGKRLLLVGDMNQLQPVIVMDETTNKQLMKNYDIPSTYDYKQNSILKSMQLKDSISKFILLRYHYRCKNSIIEFCNKKYYNEQLLIHRINDVDYEKDLKFTQVVNQFSCEKNAYETETDIVIKEAVNSSVDTTIGIITPFKAQADLIRKKLHQCNASNKHKITIGTIHSFQGEEKDKIILSFGIGQETHQKTFDWVKNNKELLNVGVSRAKDNLVVVADESAIIKLSHKDGVVTTNDTFELINHVKLKGEYDITSKTDEYTKRRLFINNSKSEIEFEETISLVLKKFGNDNIKVQSKMKIINILPKDVANDFPFFNSSEFDFVVKKIHNKKEEAILAVEVNGQEHYTDQKVIKRDNKKKELCEKNNFKLLIIDNEFVRRYDLIKREIFKVLEN